MNIHDVAAVHPDVIPADMLPVNRQYSVATCPVLEIILTNSPEKVNGHRSRRHSAYTPRTQAGFKPVDTAVAPDGILRFAIQNIEIESSGRR